jgi:hypothetical protein
VLLAITTLQAWEHRADTYRWQAAAAHANGCKHRGSNEVSVRSAAVRSGISIRLVAFKFIFSYHRHLELELKPRKGGSDRPHE